MSFNGGFFKPHQRLLQLLQACSRVRSLDNTRPLHGLSITMGSVTNQPIFLYNNIIDQYASVGELSVAHMVFDKMPHRNVISYNTLISAYSRCGNAGEACWLFLEMMGYGFRPTQFTLGALLSCAPLNLRVGVQLQGLIVKSGLVYLDAYVGTALLGLFGRHGCLDEALAVYEDMPWKNLVTWNSMISMFGHHGFVDDSMSLFRDLVRAGTSPSEYSFLGVLSGHAGEQDLLSGAQIHDLAIKMGFEYEVLVVNSLLNMYVKCFDICSAEKLFGSAPVRDVVSWSTIIGALEKGERAGIALKLFARMSLDRIFPNQATFANVISCCISLQIPKFGESIHAKILKSAFESDVYVGSALVDFYAKSDKLADANQCFDEIDEKNVVSWNALISGYSKKCSFTCISLFLEMLQWGYLPNEFSFSILLKSSKLFELLQLHCLIIRMGYQNNEYVSSSLICSYAKNGLVSDALVFITASNTPLPVFPSNITAGIYNRTGQYFETLKLLSQLEEPDIVSWNIVIAACARNGDYEEVFELFKHMHMAKIPADKYTYVSVLCVCAKLCDLALGSSVHNLMIKTKSDLRDTFVFNVLIDMYGKCGNVESSVKIFNGMMDRNIITWTALISALGVNGYANEALERFREMEFLGFKPDGVAFIAILTACRHGGLVKEGMEIFEKMGRINGVEPHTDHYHCVVDLLARNGHLKHAEKLIATMPFPPNALIWRTFLEGCRRQRTAEDQAFRHINFESANNLISVSD